MSGTYDYDYGNENRWVNWAGNFLSVPSELARPSKVSEVQDLVRNNRGASIRAVGTGHSFSPLVVTNGQLLVELSSFSEGGRKAWRWQNKGQNLATFLPSARWQDVRD